jgi:hypothetical protein
VYKKLSAMDEGFHSGFSATITTCYSIVLKNFTAKIGFEMKIQKPSINFHLWSWVVTGLSTVKMETTCSSKSW